MVSAGLPQEAVNVLQEAQLWRYAATLTANTLTGSDRAITLERWAAHIHQVGQSICIYIYMLLCHLVLTCHCVCVCCWWCVCVCVCVCALLVSVRLTEPSYLL